VSKEINTYMYDNPKNGLSRVLSASYTPAILLLFVVSVSFLMSGSYNPFIYFNF